MIAFVACVWCRLMSCALSLLVVGDIQSKAAAELEEAQRERNEAIQGMARAQVLLIPAMINSIFDQTSNHILIQRENEVLRETSLRLEEAQRDANHRLEEAHRAAADLEVLYMEWVCVYIEIRLVIPLPPHIAGPAL